LSDKQDVHWPEEYRFHN